MRYLAIFLLTGLIGGCATSDHDDPYKGFNHRMYDFNDSLDRAVLEPVAKGYRGVTPKPVRTGIRNVLGNLEEPRIFVNDILQGEFNRALNTFDRFWINSTVGIFGLIDIADALGIEKHNETFNETLAVWGVDSGAYLVLPVIGSTSPRNLLGSAVDRALSPWSWIKFDDETAIHSGRGILSLISGREGAIEAINAVRNQANPYTAVRRFYWSNLEKNIRNGQVQAPNYEDLPDFYADDFEDK